MKQLLLRVPEDLHRRLAARARREGRSVNSLATEILDVTADADSGDRGQRLRAAATAAGRIDARTAPSVNPRKRARILASTSGLGSRADAALDAERSR